MLQSMPASLHVSMLQHAWENSQFASWKVSTAQNRFRGSIYHTTRTEINSRLQLHTSQKPRHHLSVGRTYFGQNKMVQPIPMPHWKIICGSTTPPRNVIFLHTFTNEVPNSNFNP